MIRKNIDVRRTKEKLREYRIQNKFSIKNITEMFNRTGQAIYQWESVNYVSLPPLEDLYNLAKLYGVSIEDLLVLA